MVSFVLRDTFHFNNWPYRYEVQLCTPYRLSVFHRYPYCPHLLPITLHSPIINPGLATLVAVAAVDREVKGRFTLLARGISD